MRVLLKFCIVSIGICFGLCALAASVARGAPPSDFYTGFALCGLQPCYLEIVPGRTAWDEAIGLLATVPGLTLESATDLGRNYRGLQGQLRLDRNAPGGPVTHINLTPAEALKIPIGGLVAGFGSPCRFQPDFLLERMRVIYAGISAIVEPMTIEEVRGPRPGTRVLSIALFDGGQFGCADAGKGTQPWRGFRKY
jgi:hypothetical protein